MSERMKSALRIAIAMMLAYTISLWMDWDKAYWAGLAVGMCGLATDGESLQKGLLRLLGTVIAVSVLITLLSVLHQERWPMLLALCAYLFFCAYMMAGTRRWYVWFHAAFLVLVIGSSTHQDPVTSFELVALRAQQTATGIACFTFVAAVFLPTSSRDLFMAAIKRQAGTLVTLHAAAVASFRTGEPTADLKRLRGEAARQQAALPAALDAAELDSLDILQSIHHWRAALAEMDEIVEAIDRWMLTLPDHQGLQPKTALGGFDAFADEIRSRLNAVEALLDGQCPKIWPAPAAVVAQSGAADTGTAFSIGALALARDQLMRLEEATRCLVGALAATARVGVDGLGNASGRLAGSTVPAASVIPDPERIMSATRAMSGFAIAALVYVYVNDITFWNVMIINAAAAGLMSAMITPQMSPGGAMLPVTVGAIFAGILHVLIMPHLEGYTGLIVMIGLGVFLLCYFFHRPDQVVFKTQGIVMFVTGTQIDNEQTYSFLYIPNAVIANGLSLVILIAVWFFPFNFTPQKTVQRLLRRYLHSAAAVVDAMRDGGMAPETWWQRQIRLYHEGQVASIPTKLPRWVGALPPETLGESGRDGINALVTSLTVLSQRLEQLTDMRGAVRSEAWADELRDEFATWRAAIESFATTLADRPGDLDPAALQARLQQRLDRMERLVADAISEGRTRSATPLETENMHRLLAAYRGVSDALNAAVERSTQIDWVRLREPRFYF